MEECVRRRHNLEGSSELAPTLAQPQDDDDGATRNSSMRRMLRAPVDEHCGFTARHQLLQGWGAAGTPEMHPAGHGRARALRTRVPVRENGPSAEELGSLSRPGKPRARMGGRSVVVVGVEEMAGTARLSDRSTSMPTKRLTRGTRQDETRDLQACPSNLQAASMQAPASSERVADLFAKWTSIGRGHMPATGTMPVRHGADEHRMHSETFRTPSARHCDHAKSKTVPAHSKRTRVNSRFGRSGRVLRPQEVNDEHKGRERGRGAD
ncbi:hypothetical protein VTO73DRAFT_9974 [Trametes versicolor]